ncbi:anticodon-binding domain protein [Gregarina niphandrodes]|uniref:Anticodon-binding domain protein n=1 Tax=Gregarina niphandrodes TaxID=110365 RepID=A0A023AZI9_GRENI|nr:anticodon-binding domain protein [Gregarina niphandrodes]EZG43730.1 anticodon-binding domain protein [Gregarina niphandrodes]|eukprot:XP_011133039.1 anticodon-binding domain protein [Gregarina niphandrodes]
MLNSVRITPPAADAEVSDLSECALDEAFKREADNINTLVPMGTGVSVMAQSLFDNFYKQLPKDTRWYNDGSGQDIIVLGVRVRYPYNSDCCEPLDQLGHKSLRRIRDMVSNFAPKKP